MYNRNQNMNDHYKRYLEQRKRDIIGWTTGGIIMAILTTLFVYTLIMVTR